MAAEKKEAERIAEAEAKRLTDTESVALLLQLDVPVPIPLTFEVVEPVVDPGLAEAQDVVSDGSDPQAK